MPAVITSAGVLEHRDKQNFPELRGFSASPPSPPSPPPPPPPPSVHHPAPVASVCSRKRPFVQRTCCTNRAPFRKHTICGDLQMHRSVTRTLSPAGGHESRAGTPLPKFLDNSGNAIPPPTTAPVVPDQTTEDRLPVLLHRVKSDRSVLSLVVSGHWIYAGNQNGEILIWSIETYQLAATFKAHQGAVLSLHLAEDQDLLFSSAGDAIVNVWSSETFEHIYSIYSTFDVGDVFCVVYSKALQTVFFGAQNTSIQWYDLKSKDTRPRPTLESHPSQRNHRFFDSKGPGGRCAPRPTSNDGSLAAAASKAVLLEVDPVNIVQYAHYGYVYCMLLVSGQHIGRCEGDMLLSGGGDGAVKLWSISPDTGRIKEVHRLEGGDAGVLSMAVKDTFLYCGLTDGEICIWDLDTLQLVRTVKAHCDDVLTLSVKGNCIFSGSASGYTRKWNHRFECISRWQSHSGLVLASAVTTRRDRLLYVTGGNDDCVAIWDVSGAEAEANKPPTKSQNDQLLSSLAKLVSYRTVASNPTYIEDCRRGATYLKTLFKRYGAMSTLLPTEGNRNPIVLARFSRPGVKQPNRRKTILFYGHYDVISAESSESGGWRTDPFELTGLNGCLYGRGVSDNKGPILAALFAAGELMQEGLLEGDIVFLIEGEEECGSPGFKGAVQRNKEKIGDVDWILLANSYWLDDETPCLTYGLRGVVHATVSVESEKPDLHSGVDGSYLNPEPTVELVGLLACLRDVHGRIQIPGFYDPIQPVSDAEASMYAAISSTLAPRQGLDEEQHKAYLMSKWRFPSLTIHRVNVSGPSNATIIPRSASAAISLRIVPNQTAEEVKRSLVSFLEEQYASYFGGNRLRISIDHEAEPWLGDPENQAFQTLERAITEVWKEPDAAIDASRTDVADGMASAANGSGKKLLYIREGGSIPGIRFLEKEFAAPAAHLPCGQASDAAHLNNERLRLVNLYKSKAILKRVFKELPLA